jgi:hypothetical protein
MECSRIAELRRLQKRVDAFFVGVQPEWDQLLSTPGEVYTAGFDLMARNQPLFEPVKNLYLSRTSHEAFANFSGILGHGTGSDAARNVYYVLDALFSCGGTEHRDKMLEIDRVIGRDAFGKRMNWLRRRLFHKTPGWNGREHAYYCFVDGFSSEALNSDYTFFYSFISIR